jgi:hypothetical protein
MIDDRRWHIYKDRNSAGYPWHVELTVNGIHCPSPNEPSYKCFEDARGFVARHVDARVRRLEQLSVRPVTLSV